MPACTPVQSVTIMCYFVLFSILTHSLIARIIPRGLSLLSLYYFFLSLPHPPHGDATQWVITALANSMAAYRNSLRARIHPENKRNGSCPEFKGPMPPLDSHRALSGSPIRRGSMILPPTVPTQAGLGKETSADGGRST